MPYKSALLGRIHVVRWESSPQAPDGSRLLTELETYHRRVGKKLTNLSLVSNRIAAPEGNEQQEMMRRRHIWTDMCEHVHVVVQGEGFKHAIVRSVIAGIAIGFTKRGFLEVHRSMAAAITRIAAELDEDAVILRRRVAAAIGIDESTLTP